MAVNYLFDEEEEDEDSPSWWVGKITKTRSRDHPQADAGFCLVDFSTEGGGQEWMDLDPEKHTENSKARKSSWCALSA